MYNYSHKFGKTGKTILIFVYILYSLSTHVKIVNIICESFIGKCSNYQIMWKKRIRIQTKSDWNSLA